MARTFAPQSTRTWRAAPVLMLAGVASTWAGVAAADTKQQCLASYDKAQTLIQSNKFVQAREELRVCGRAECPGFVADDCGKWLSEVDARTPTVVIDARAPDGQDAVDVTVEVDGKPFISKIDGRALPLDPGEHMFKFQMPGAQPIERRFVIHESVKGRHISVQFEPLAPDAGAAVPSAASAARSPTPAPVGSPLPGARDAAPGKRGGVGAPVYVLGGLGLLGIASFAWFGLDYDKRLDELDGCKPNCDVSRTDRANVSRVLAFVSAGIGVAALGTATVVLLASGGKKQGGDAARYPAFDLVPLSGGAMGVLRGSL